MSLLQVDNLHTHFVTRDRDNQVRTATALNGVSFALADGEVLGLVGETGAGKSLTATSIMGLLRPPARIVEGRISFGGRTLTDMPPDELNALRGNEIAIVVQSPKTSLDPLMRIGDQIVRVIQAHRRMERTEAYQRALKMLAAVGIPDPERRAQALPHELSGGMAQRVLIAMALINEPRLLVADEPTTGLDVTVQAQILDMLRRLVSEMGMASLVITHDLGIVAHYCDRVAVMFAGRIVEIGPTAAVFGNPAHPYTRALIGSAPENFSLAAGRPGRGEPPNLYALPPGCHYVDRCPLADSRCAQMPPLVSVSAGHEALCHKATVTTHG